MKVEQFQGQYRFLSNFWPAVIDFEGLRYLTVEHAYQAAKTTDPTERDAVRCADTPGQAKRAGRGITLRPDWEQVKLGVMEQLLRQKFSDPQLRQALLATGEAELVEGNHWGDTYWGVCKGTGQNNLGRLLMKIRTELSRSGSQS